MRVCKWLGVLGWALGKLMHLNLSRGFAKWTEHVGLHRGAVRRLRAALIHLYSTHLGPAFRTWLSRGRQATWLSQRLPWPLEMKIESRALAGAFDAWRSRAGTQATHTHREVALHDVRRRRHYRRALLAWFDACGDPRTLEAQVSERGSA